MTLPIGWRSAALGDVARWGSGGTPKAGTPEYYGGDIPWAVIGDLCDGPIGATSNRITRAGLAASSAKRVPAGAVLVAMYGSIGKLGLTTAELTTNQAIAFAVPDPELVEARFLFYYLLSQRGALSAAGKGATQRNIGQGTLKAWHIPVPPIPVQRRIVEILEDHLSRLDAGLGYLAAADARASTCVESWLALAFAGHAASDLKSLLAAPLANGRSVPTAASGFGVLRLTALADGRIDLAERKIGAWTADEARPFLVAEGDYLVSRGNGSLQRVALGGIVPEVQEPVAYPDTMIRIRPRKDLVLPEYFGAVWNSRVVRRQIEASARTTAGIYKVNQQQLEHVVLPMPSLTEQHRIACEFTDLRATVEKQRRAILSGTRRAEALRRALLAAAFSGGLTASGEAEAIEEMTGA